MKVISQVLLAVFLGWLGAGCRSVAPVQPENLKALEIDGLTLSVYPLTTKQEVKQIFKVNLLNRGVLPIQVKAENHNPSSSFIIAKEKVLVMSETTQMTNAPGEIAKQMGTWSRSRQLGVAGSFAVGVPAIIGVPGLLLAAMKPTEGAFVFKPAEENLSGKEFQTRTLEPGQMAEGFIYFPFTNPTN